MKVFIDKNKVDTKVPLTNKLLKARFKNAVGKQGTLFRS